MAAKSVYCGLLVDCGPDWSLRLEEEGILVLGGARILERTAGSRDGAELEAVLARHGVTRDQVVFLAASQFLLPGLVDTHIHASQFPNAGIDRQQHSTVLFA
jgi:cytosine/adenosine deaminase-related metal-dependent hydrolase